MANLIPRIIVAMVLWHAVNAVLVYESVCDQGFSLQVMAQIQDVGICVCMDQTTNTHSNVTWIYNITTETWTIPLLIIPIGSSLVTNDIDTLYVIGGAGIFGNVLTSYNIYSQQTNQTTFSDPRISPSVFFSRDSIVIIGGQDSHQHSRKTIEIYDIPSKTWSSRNFSSLPASGPQEIVEYDGVVYTAVLQNNSYTYVDTLAIFNLSTFELEEIELNRLIDASNVCNTKTGNCGIYLLAIDPGLILLFPSYYQSGIYFIYSISNTTLTEMQMPTSDYCYESGFAKGNYAVFNLENQSANAITLVYNGETEETTKLNSVFTPGNTLDPYIALYGFAPNNQMSLFDTLTGQIIPIGLDTYFSFGYSDNITMVSISDSSCTFNCSWNITSYDPAEQYFDHSFDFTIQQINVFSFAVFESGFIIPGTNKLYVTKKCQNDQGCSDGIFCNGEEYCNHNFYCSNGIPSCSIDECNICDVYLDQCGYASKGTACGTCGMCDGSGQCDNPTSCSIDSVKGPVSIKNILIAFGSVVGSLLIFFGIVATILIIRTKKLRKYQQLSTIEENYPQVYDVEVGDRIASGEFGDVYKGVMDDTVNVALKTLKREEFTEEFQREVALLSKLNHPHVIRMYGVYLANSSTYMVFEFMDRGSLNRLLIAEKQNIDLEKLIKMALQMASGMKYLEANHIVHRDLALRNVFATLNERGEYAVKIGDFGMSRSVEKGYYKTDDKTIPVRWSAPEFIHFGITTSKSDTWSFAVCLWELFSYGAIPFAGLSNRTVIEEVSSGKRLEQPPNCPEEVYALMQTCWYKEPEQRPTFVDVHASLVQIARPLIGYDETAYNTEVPSESVYNM